MFSTQFLKSKLGQAALASVAAMSAFVALSSQLQVSPALAHTQPVGVVELA